ncbi:MAG: DNA-binding NtrC family response regulator [Desulforhopalus sp.]|jgi:DNA-binding NtrC family response regulator
MVPDMYKKSTCRIVVTDTNHHVRDFIRRELEKEGYTVTCVSNPIEAYNSICDTTSLDIIILDPDLISPYGQSFLTQFLERTPSTHIIIHTFDKYIYIPKTDDKIHIVEKTATSIDPLKEIIEECASSITNLRKKVSL